MRREVIPILESAFQLVDKTYTKILKKNIMPNKAFFIPTNLKILWHPFSQFFISIVMLNFNVISVLQIEWGPECLSTPLLSQWHPRCRQLSYACSIHECPSALPPGPRGHSMRSSAFIMRTRPSHKINISHRRRRCGLQARRSRSRPGRS